MRFEKLHRRIRAGLSAGLLFAAAPLYAASSQDATVTVTPQPQIALSLDATTYAFGVIDVGQSTNSATALTLTNTGEVSVTVDKQILVQSEPAGWIAADATGHDTYVLYAATSTARLNLADFGAAARFGQQGLSTDLTGPGGLSPVLTPLGAEQSVQLWLRLDMPDSISTIQGRAMTIQFTATAE